MSDCGCNNIGERTFVGTMLKYALTIEAEGFSMADDDFEVLLKRGPNSLLLKKDDLVVDEHGQYYVCFDSKPLGPGIVSAVITAKVPDDDFPDGVRDEVYKLELVNLLGV